MQKICVKSFGCSANVAEGEMIKGDFAKKDEIVSDEKEADAIVLNICTVKGDKTALAEIRKFHEQHPNKKIIVSGCITPSIVPAIKNIDPNAVLINTHNIDKITEFANTKTDILTQEKPIKLLRPRVRTNPVIGIVPISSGCLDACAFCSTRLVKGVLFSFPPEIIESEVRKCIEDGCKEIWITGQDTCCYGFDRKTNLAKLLKNLVEIEGDFKIRIGMGNPRHLPRFFDEFIEVMKHPKVFKFIHLPMQSGNDRVLKAMKRGHNVQQLREMMQKLRKEIPEINISTDIIVGFPTETEEEFMDTVNLIKELMIGTINIARFAARPGTSAASMENQIHGRITKDRSRILTNEYRKVAKQENEKWLNWNGEVIVDEKIKDAVGARNYAYKQIVIRKDLPLGTKINVKITEAHNHFLVGTII